MLARERERVRDANPVEPAGMLAHVRQQPLKHAHLAGTDCSMHTVPQALPRTHQLERHSLGRQYQVYHPNLAGSTGPSECLNDVLLVVKIIAVLANHG